MAYSPMTARSREEHHRAATPLELFFDLCFVVAIAQAGARLVHALAEGHPGTGVIGYFLVFFGVWWAWMNFTWFASAYDVDDVPYRIATLVEIAGVLVYAAGVGRAFDENDWTVAVIGYVIMRVAQTAQWLRAAAGESGPARAAALKYAAGLVICQAGWVALLFAPEDSRRWLFLVMVAAELMVPVVAERHHQTPWHAHHIVERYGLFTIIVLGETIAAATVAVKSAVDEHEALGELLPIAGGGLLIVFSAWWIYFAVPMHERLNTNREAIPWGYGHLVIFASGAAIGAGIEVAVEHAVGLGVPPDGVPGNISQLAANAAVTVPSAVFLMTVWFLHSRHFKRGLAQQLTLPLCALALLACTWTGTYAVLYAGLVTAATVAIGLTLTTRSSTHPSPAGSPSSPAGV
ncbi:low temperature requirement protein A [Streptomyces sp. ISL-94]|uniref:low temperature requirement protein A n=1 Tax=Streptomyces sp. ISL-94 TaxID=2819190 RepID=UPI001BE65056|nr:low temperature requirement protein A [Streptomyces sp. ISL-94]MBT2479476.1 low temperature requirement protein A [Streptomyces sp. ISL-94]